tara:strand:- start:8729 stop:9655 length:927 start_codon:yes stop_codon:yes gene_type:complete
MSNNVSDLLKIENKEFLWNVLYKNNVFNAIPNSKTHEIKSLFEETIINSIDFIKQNNLQNNNLLELNKIIVKNLNSNIIAYKSQILSPIDSKDDYKKTKFDGLQQEFNRQKESMNNTLNADKPNTIDFSDKNDEPIENNIMLLKLQEMEKERNINLNNNQSNQEKQNNEIELNIEELNFKPITNVELEEQKEQQQESIGENSVPKIKISNIEDLLQNDLNIENLDSNNETNALKEELHKQKYEDSRKNYFQKRDSRINITNIDEVLKRDNSHEFITNHNMKNDSINEMLATILHNQKLIMEKLEIYKQ